MELTKKGLLLVNLGSPVAPTTQAVKSYLLEFLSDQNVVELPKWFWQPILQTMVLPMRSPRSAASYRDIWQDEGSPLAVYTKAMTQKIQAQLTDWDVRYAMTYGQPDISQQLHKMKAAKDEQIVVLPLFPQYTKSTHGGIMQQVADSGVDTTIIKSFYQYSKYQKILAQQIDNYYQAQDYDAVLFSYHGIPTSMVKQGDPYWQECQDTTAGVKQYLKLPHYKVHTVFQSKFGPTPWLQPYLKNTLIQLAQAGKKKVLLVTPSFVADCLETLEEDGVENKEIFLENGGETLTLVPPMNADSQFCQFLGELSVATLND